jgi:hypothetical protein
MKVEILIYVYWLFFLSWNVIREQIRNNWIFDGHWLRRCHAGSHNFDRREIKKSERINSPDEWKKNEDVVNFAQSQGITHSNNLSFVNRI